MHSPLVVLLVHSVVDADATAMEARRRSDRNSRVMLITRFCWHCSLRPATDADEVDGVGVW